MPTTKINGAKFNYIQLECKEAGVEADNLVMVHGLGTNLAFWFMHYAEEFAKRFNVILYDLRGHGRSEATIHGYSVASMARDLAALLGQEHLGINKAHFIAHSFGGAIALKFALDCPDQVSSLVLADTHISAMRSSVAVQKWEHGKKIVQLMNQHGVSICLDEPFLGHRLLAELAKLQRDKVDISEELYQLIKPVVGSYSDRTAKQWLNLLENTEAEAEFKIDDGLSIKQLGTLKFPIATIYGERSQSVFTWEKLLEVWPHAKHICLQNAGHFFPLTQPDELKKYCHQFWDEIPQFNNKLA